MVRIDVKKRYGGTTGVPTKSIYRKKLAVHRQTDVNFKRLGERITFEGYLVSVYFEIEKLVSEMEALRSVEMIGRGQVKRKGEGA